MMTCGVNMVTDGGSAPEMLLETFPKGPCRFPYVHLITLQSLTLIPVEYSTFLWKRGHQEHFDGVASCELDLDPHSVHIWFLKLSFETVDTTIWMLLWLMLLLWLSVL